MMRTISKSFLLTVVIITHFGLCFIYGQDTIRIMPLGNSITEGYTDGSLTNDQLRSYRYGLKYLLKNSGYKIDFVGSQTGGCAYFTDCQHAGIGGTRDQYLVDLLTSGYDTRHGIQILVPPRLYLDEYQPDIILLHIGTNDITHEGDAALTNQKITNILDLIDQYETRANKEVIVFLALIINRVKPWLAGSAALKTSNFNNGIKLLAQSRIASGDNIVIVDMENDAGFEYSCDIDMMPDGLHPNELGYSKMATLWSSSITSNYNKAPEIAPIPDQVFEEDGNSAIISLDTYVSDYEDLDNQIIWTFTQLISSNLNITINANRQVVATAREADWNGSQKVVFMATDSGKNGAYRKSDTDTVVFTVTPIDDAPVITSTPILEARVGELYSYTLTATDVDNDVISFSTVSALPSWLTFSEISKLTGIPETINQGQNQVILRVSSGSLFIDQNITITVDNPNAINNPENVDLHFYPVPARNYLIVKFGNLTGEILLEILNASGLRLYKASLHSSQDFYELDLNNFENGIYFLHVFNQSKFFTGKFTVLK